MHFNPHRIVLLWQQHDTKINEWFSFRIEIHYKVTLYFEDIFSVLKMNHMDKIYWP